MCCVQTLPLCTHTDKSTHTNSTNFMRIVAIDSTNCIFFCVELQHALNQLHIIKSRTQDKQRALWSWGGEWLIGNCHRQTNYHYQVAPLKCVHLKKTKWNSISAETKQTLSRKQNNMQQPKVIKGCYAKSIKFVFQTKTFCNAICNNHMSYYAVM